MKVVVQRVSAARVIIGGEVTASIGRGLLLLVGLAMGDGEAEVAWMAHKIAGLRIFDDAVGQLNASVGDVSGEMLVVPQFTLLGDCRKGKRPSFAAAMRPAEAQALFDRFIALFEGECGTVAAGRFGASMQVELVNDGPVTLVIER